MKPSTILPRSRSSRIVRKRLGKSVMIPSMPLFTLVHVHWIINGPGVYFQAGGVCLRMKP